MLAEFAAAGFDRVDLVLFESAPLLLRFEALRRNKLVYKRDPDVDMADVFSRTLREFWDFRPKLERRALLYKEKFAHGST